MYGIEEIDSTLLHIRHISRVVVAEGCNSRVDCVGWHHVLVVLCDHPSA